MKSLRGLFKNKYLVTALIVVFFCLIVISRRVDVITYPQFYAEDGVFWYLEAYNANNFWEPFLTPKQGYFQTISRIGGLMAQFVNLQYAPYVMNAFAILIQIAPALFFVSGRFEHIVAKRLWRFLIGFAYLALPATFETHANLTNAMWRLSIVSFLVIIASVPTKKWQKVVDSIILFISGLSGPFVFFLFPILLIHWKFSLHKKRSYQFISLGIAFLIQIYSYIATLLGFYTVDVRSDAPLGASIVVFLKLLSGKVFIMGVFGMKIYQEVFKWRIWETGFLPIIVGVAVVLLFGYAFWRVKLEIKLFLLFALLVFFAGLATPQVSLNDPQWIAMLGPRPGNRYFLLPIIALIISITYLAFQVENKYLKILGFSLLICFSLGVVTDWKIQKYKNFHFDDQVSEFSKLSSGEKFDFKISPGWNMTLVKK